MQNAPVFRFLKHVEFHCFSRLLRKHRSELIDSRFPLLAASLKEPRQSNSEGNWNCAKIRMACKSSAFFLPIYWVSMLLFLLLGKRDALSWCLSRNRYGKCGRARLRWAKAAWFGRRPCSLRRNSRGWGLLLQKPESSWAHAVRGNRFSGRERAGSKACNSAMGSAQEDTGPHSDSRAQKRGQHPFAQGQSPVLASSRHM